MSRYEQVTRMTICIALGAACSMAATREKWAGLALFVAITVNYVLVMPWVLHVRRERLRDRIRVALRDTSSEWEPVA